MRTFVLDLRQSLRSTWKAPGFLVMSALSLGLGIGANLATFSVLRAAMAPGVAWKNPEELVHVGRKDAQFPMLPDTLDVSPERFRRWQEHQAVLAPLAAWAGGSGVIGGSIEPRSVTFCRVSPEFWSTLGLQPLMGRLPRASEEDALVVSHRLWMTVLGGDRAVLGRSFTLAGRAYALVGVLPARAAWFRRDAFVPLVLTDDERRGGFNFLQLVGRMRPGVTQADVQAAFRTMNAQLQSSVPVDRQVSAVPRPLLTRINMGTSGGRRLLVWISVFVTILACVNLCMLALGRSAARLQELGIRRALGARQAQLFTPLFADLLVAVAPGLALGWAFSRATSRLLEAFLPTMLQPFHGPSPASVLVGVAAALALAVAGGGIPALLLPRLAIVNVLRTARSTAGTGGGRIQKGLVAMQVALGVTLVSSFALVYRSAGQLKEAPVGIATEGRLLATVSLSAQGSTGVARRQAEVAQVLEKIRALPGVKAAGGTDLVPVASGGGFNGQITVPGQPKPVFTYFRAATDGYFEAAGIPLLEGRTFRPSDVAENPVVAIVSRSFARDYFPGQGAVGRVIATGGAGATIVGVVGDARMDDLRQISDTQTFYYPSSNARLDLVVQASLRAQGLLPTLRRILRAQWPDVSLDDVRPLSEALAQGSASAGQRAALMGLLASLALVLAMTGIYGVLSRQVETRRQEMGLRRALGGRRVQVVGLVLRQSMAMAVLGLAIGLLGAAAMGRVIRSELYEVDFLDPRSHAFALVLLAATALAASFVPALRASSVEPIETLRES